MVFFVNHCELPIERVRFRFIPAPHAPVHLRHQPPPPPPGAQPDIHPPNNLPMVHIDVAIGRQQPNVQPPVVGVDVNNQNDVGPHEMRIPSQAEGGGGSLRRRVGGAAFQTRGGAQGSEESTRDEGGSELVSGSSTRSLFNSSTRRQALQMRYSLQSSNEGASTTSPSLEPGVTEGELGGILSRESIRTARLNRFQRTNHETIANNSDLAD